LPTNFQYLGLGSLAFFSQIEDDDAIGAFGYSCEPNAVLREGDILDWSSQIEISGVLASLYVVELDLTIDAPCGK
jgi:hypothetical protein